MVIFNNTDYPVRLMLGNRDYTLERGVTELDDGSLDAGELTVRAEIDYPIGALAVKSHRDNPFRRGYISFPLAVGAKLTVAENTYLHIDEAMWKDGRRAGYFGYHPTLRAERGELSSLGLGYASASGRRTVLGRICLSIAVGGVIMLAFWIATALICLGGSLITASGSALAADIALFILMLGLDGLLFWLMSSSVKIFRNLHRLPIL